MLKKLAHLTLYVRDCEEALQFYTEKLGFEKRMDVKMDNGARWLTIGVLGQEVAIVLHDPTHWHAEDAAERMLAQVGHNPMWVLETDDIYGTWESYRQRGVTFIHDPAEVLYGTEAMFQDLYGNKYLLLQTAAM